MGIANCRILVVDDGDSLREMLCDVLEQYDGVPFPAASGEEVVVVLPALGESVTEGVVTRWLKAVGDTVAADEPLV